MDASFFSPPGRVPIHGEVEGGRLGIACVEETGGRPVEAPAPARRPAHLGARPGDWGRVVLGPDHRDTTIALADLLRDQGELAAARALYERAVAIWERVQGPDHPDTARCLHNLAGLLRDQGELAAAKPLYERALATRERVLGPDHPDTAHSLNDLGALLRDQGELATARPLLERALATRERVLGPDHPDTATTRDDLANLARRGLAGPGPWLPAASNKCPFVASVLSR